MKEAEPQLSASDQKLLERIEHLSMKDEKNLLARIIVEQGIANGILERTRKNTSTLTTMAWVVIIISIIAALIPSNTNFFEILN